MKNELAVIILTWNDFNNTIDCLKSILNQNYKKYKIFLIDNNSDDEIFLKTLGWLKLNYKKDFYKNQIDPKKKISKRVISNYKIFYSRNSKNLGCGYGHNTGYKIAINNNFDLVARIDNDMEMPKNFFLKILKNFENQNIQAVSPKILYKEARNNIWWMGTTIDNNLKFQRHMRNYKYGEKDKNFKNKIISSDAVAGCASIMRVKRLKKVGLSDKDFFYGPEDIELSRRLSTNKNSLIVDLNSNIYHGVSKSFTDIPLKRVYFEYKYRLLLIKKIGTPLDKLFGYSVAILKFFVYLAFFLKKKHRKKIKPVFFAIIHFHLNKVGDFDRKKLFDI